MLKLLSGYKAFAVVFLLALANKSLAQAPGATVPAPVGEVQATGFLAASEIKTRETVRFWLTVRNRLPLSVTDVRVHRLDSAGFEIVRRCWCGAERAACGEPPLPAAPSGAGLAPPSPDCNLLTDKLTPGQTFTVWGDLRATEARDLSNVTLVIEWRNPDKSPSEAAVSLGACKVRDRAARIGAFVKDYGVTALLPLALGLFPLYYKWLESKRARKDEQWNLMLPESRELSRRHYLPLASAVGQATAHLAWVEGALSSLAKEPDQFVRRNQERQLTAPVRTAFFYWVLTWRQLRNLFDSVGGLHFMDRVGEKLVASCQEKFASLYWHDDPHQHRVLTRILDHIEVNEKIDSFEMKLEEELKPNSGTSLGLREGWSFFQKWVRSPDCGECLLYLKWFEALVVYEANRPFEYWYGMKQQIGIDPALGRVIRELAKERAKQDPALADFPRQVSKYLAEGGVGT